MKSLFIFAVGCFSAYVTAVIFSYMWLWFAVPLGLPPIGVAESAGLCLLAAWPTAYRSLSTFALTVRGQIKVSENIWSVFVYGCYLILACPLTFGFAYVWHLLTMR